MKNPPNDAYLSIPASGSGPGVLVLHAWWGFNDFMRRLCDRLVGAGFTVLAPDLYHGAIASTIEQAETLSGELKLATAQQELSQAVTRLRSLEATQGQEIGLLGFSLGGFFALWLAEQPETDVAATVVFYATRPGDYSQSRSAFQFHLAESDDFEAESDVMELRQSLQSAGREAEFFTYPGTTHWFFESDRPDAFHPKAAELAWGRTAAFFKKRLG
jgi:carboxymethylenebutenolidase